MMKKIVSWLGKVIMIIALGVIVGKLWEYRESIDIVITPVMILHLSVASILYALVVYMCPFIYQNAVYITSGKKVQYYKVANIYCKSNIYKYLPGNVMQYVGRNEIAIMEDISHSKAALATLIEIGATFLSAILLTCIVSFDKALEWIEANVEINVSVIIGLILVVCIVLVVAIFLMKKYCTELYKSIFSVSSLIRLGGIVLYSALILLLNSLLYYYVLYAMNIQLSLDGYWVGIGLYALAFVLGYVTPGVPGGIGIREAIMVYFFSAYILEAEILAGAVVFRVVTIIGDFIAYLLSLVINIRKKGV